jgi:hypothetical protein
MARLIFDSHLPDHLKGKTLRVIRLTCKRPLNAGIDGLETHSYRLRSYDSLRGSDLLLKVSTSWPIGEKSEARHLLPEQHEANVIKVTTCIIMPPAQARR